MVSDPDFPMREWSPIPTSGAGMVADPDLGCWNGRNRAGRPGTAGGGRPG
jgi:hypothetical protein